MGRWPAGAQDRMQQAAIQLFTEQGYGATTVADIAARGGLTERSFYNHFTDKREVLFPSQDRFVAELVEALRTAPDDQLPLDVVTSAFAATTDWFDRRRDAARLRRRIIDGHAELQEREAAKFAALRAAIAAGLSERGSSDCASALTAAATVAAYQLATARWLADPRRQSLDRHLYTAVEELRETARRW